MEWLLTSNSANARVLRTVIQGIIAVIPSILNYYAPFMPDWFSVILVPAIMCILSPVMAELGAAIKEKQEEDHIIGGTD